MLHRERIITRFGGTTYENENSGSRPCRPLPSGRVQKRNSKHAGGLGKRGGGEQQGAYHHYRELRGIAGEIPGGENHRRRTELDSPGRPALA
jgi:hypothetical protein